MNQIEIIKSSLIKKGINLLIKKGDKMQALKIMKNLTKIAKVSSIESTINKISPEFKTKVLKNKTEVTQALTLKQKQQIGLKKTFKTPNKAKLGIVKLIIKNFKN